MRQVHELKTDPSVFELSWSGRKAWEIRQDDRRFRRGDYVLLRETLHSGAAMAQGAPLVYTGREIRGEILASIGGYGLLAGWVVLSVRHILRLKTCV